MASCLIPVEAIGQPRESFLTSIHFGFWVSVSPCPGLLTSQTRIVRAAEWAREFACLSLPPRSGITNTCYHAWIAYWVLGSNSSKASQHFAISQNSPWSSYQGTQILILSLPQNLINSECQETAQILGSMRTWPGAFSLVTRCVNSINSLSPLSLNTMRTSLPYLLLKGYHILFLIQLNCP